jgi:four helix bundle protein
MAVKSYQDLVAWQKAMDLTVEVYRLTMCFPKEEMYGLSRQLRDAMVSVPSNTAEGQGRRSTREFRHHLSIARGSLQEVETQLVLAARLGYLPPQDIEDALEHASEVGRLLNGLYNSLSA